MHAVLHREREQLLPVVPTVPSLLPQQRCRGLCHQVLALSVASLLSVALFPARKDQAHLLLQSAPLLVWIMLQKADSLSHLLPLHWSASGSAPLFSSFLLFLAIQYTLSFLFIYLLWTGNINDSSCKKDAVNTRLAKSISSIPAVLVIWTQCQERLFSWGNVGTLWQQQSLPWFICLCMCINTAKIFLDFYSS